MFGLAFVWAAFATIQDFRKTEIANWLNFSLIAFVLAYRAFYSIFINDFGFFLFGLFGMALFFVLAFAFYYGKIFGGGDAKLLIGLGGILPYQTFFDYLYLGLGFIFVLFLGGAIYTLIYSLFLVSGNMKKFSKEFGREFRQKRKLFFLVLQMT